MKFWLASAWTETQHLTAVAQFAEDVGFYGIMNGDHAVYPTHIAPNYPYSDDGLPPMQADWEYPDPWVSIAAMAAVTQRIKFTTGVYLLALRNPHDVARATASLAIISDNRFMLGLGAGWMPEEFAIYSVDYTTRGRRLDEAIDVIQQLWRGQPCRFNGRFYQHPEVVLSPVPNQPIPLYVGGDSDAALKRAARIGSGFLGRGNYMADVLPLLHRLQQCRTDAGRDQLPFETVIPLLEKVSVDQLALLEAAGMTSTVCYPFRMTIGPNASLDQKKRYLETFARDFIEPLTP